MKKILKNGGKIKGKDRVRESLPSTLAGEGRLALIRKAVLAL